jgi:exodeoxyribonuclease V alpha subunit
MRTVVVENILTANGAIFSARDESGVLHRFIANAMPRSPVRGEAWEIAGMQRRHPLYGPQVHVTSAALLRPSGRLIVDILRGPRFPGIGDVTARTLWEAMGESLYDVLDAGDTLALQAILGDSERSRAQVKTLLEVWPEVVAEPQVIRWLDRHGVTPRLARKLLDCYGPQTEAKLNENPYRLLAFAPWSTVDRIALGMGVEGHDPRRLIAVCEAKLYARLDRTHTWTSDTVLRRDVAQVLGDAPLVERAIELASADAIVRMGNGWQAVGPYAMERWLADRVGDLLSGVDSKGSQPILFHRPFDELLRGNVLEAWQREHRLVFNERQREAVHMALTTPFGLVLGGAGVGKTTVLRAVCDLAERMGLSTHLMALSGRAALRITEATGRPARTIAGWLQSRERGELALDDEPLIIIDEASMVDLASLYRIFRSTPPGCRFLLVGDPGQLPPVSFGVTLHAFAESDLIPQVELTDVMRQSAETGIPTAAAFVRSGQLTRLDRFDPARDMGVSFVDAAPDRIVDVIERIWADLAGARVQIIGSIKGRGRREDAGIRAINNALHASYAHGRTPLLRDFVEGEPVIWTVNDYDLNLMNGALGTVLRRDDGGEAAPSLVVRFDHGEVRIEGDQLEFLELAWAITTHKSQGSAFDTVVIPVTANRILDRTLLYTAITRARRRVVMIGDRAALQDAVTAPPTSAMRETGLRDALRSVVDVQA